MNTASTSVPKKRRNSYCSKWITTSSEREPRRPPTTCPRSTDHLPSPYGRTSFSVVCRGGEAAAELWFLRRRVILVQLEDRPAVIVGIGLDHLLRHAVLGGDRIDLV